jgi:hypothetical protein
VERSRLFDVDDSSKESRQRRDLLRSLHKMVHNPQAQSSSTNSYTKSSSRSPVNVQEATACNSSSSRLCHDLPRGNWFPDRILVSKFWNVDLAPAQRIRYHLFGGRNIPCYRLGSSYLHHCGTYRCWDYCQEA